MYEQPFLCTLGNKFSIVISYWVFGHTLSSTLEVFESEMEVKSVMSCTQLVIQNKGQVIPKKLR